MILRLKRLTSRLLEEIQETELHFIQTDSVNLSQIRLYVTLDGLHEFDLIRASVIDCLHETMTQAVCSVLNELHFQPLKANRE